MRCSDILTPLCFFAAASSAWPTGWQPYEAIKREIAPLMARQDDTTSKFDLSYSGVQGNTATTEASSTQKDSEATTTSDGDAKSTGDGDSTTTGKGHTTGKETGKSTGQTTDKPTATSGKNGKSTKTKGIDTSTIDPRIPQGGVSMITPNAFKPQYYKIGSTAGQDFATFAWNYTSLVVTPSAVDVLASCSLNSATYTITQNMSISGATQEVLWDIGAYQATATIPLLTETYTLIIHDAAKDVSATAQPGQLGTWEQLTFGMYVPQTYKSIKEGWTCTTCSGAMSLMERQTLGFMFGMVALTVLSFGWFSGVAGLI